jgi:hypothetical protein
LQPEAFGVLLRYVASFGFFVLAPNTREVGTGTVLTHALDFAAAANQDPSSPYFGRLDLGKVGVMGHSQGAAATITVATDPRIDDVIVFNGNSATAKPFLTVSGDMDVNNQTAQGLATAVNGATKAAYLFYHNPAGTSADTLKGHLLVMLTPERVVVPTKAWWQMLLESDQTARAQFVGSSCGLCNKSSESDFGEHGL